MKFHLDLRHVIQSSFLPLMCQCTISPAGIMSVRVTDPASSKELLLKSGIAAASLNNSRAISNLVAELRFQLANNQAALAHNRITK